MINNKRIGVWMDHASAHLMEFNASAITTVTVDAAFTPVVKQDSLEKSEYLMHNKEQGTRQAYYKKIATVLKEYGEVLLFGPTEAKQELFNLLRGDQHFNNTALVVQAAGKLTENQQHAFVRDYFAAKASGKA
jgi:stalled ribosome rescue protein Dom34